jgi:60 kDa SS-A/Ro ribonucleoprotein
VSQTNVGQVLPVKHTHNGGKAQSISAEQQLRRTVLTCLLWEDNFYEDGQSVADRVKGLVPKVSVEYLHLLAVEARTEFYLRHVPLLLARELARDPVQARRSTVAELLPAIIQRPDEITEFVALYWKDNNGKKTLSAAVKRGLAAAFRKFTEFTLSKYDRKDKPVRLRDVMFLCHVKPADLANPGHRWTRDERKPHYAAVQRGLNIKRKPAFTEQELLLNKVAQDELKQHGTWEDRMSAGEKPKVVFEDLMEKGELGALAFIRNVRKMVDSGVEQDMMRNYATTVRLRGVLPHQIVTAARHNPQFEPMFEGMMLRSLDGMGKLPGTTVFLVDVSGSMDDPLSKRPNSTTHVRKRKVPPVQPVEDTKRVDTACALAMMGRELCENVYILTFSSALAAVPPRRGFALRDAILGSQPHQSTHLAAAVRGVNARFKYDRIIVITDEQSDDGIAPPLPGAAAYVMNVASYENGVTRGMDGGRWVGISGWSPHALRFIEQLEADELAPMTKKSQTNTR